MKMRKTRRSRGGLVLLLCGMVALTSFFLFPGTRAQAATPAFVRIVHASPFVGTADVYLDGNPKPLLQTFPFGDVTDYASIPPGPHKVQIALVGKGIGGAALTETLAVQPGGVYTIAAIGTTPTSLTLKVFVDSNLATNGMSRVRIYQLSPDGGWLDIRDNGKWMAGADYQNATGYLTLAPGAATFNLDSASMKRSLSLLTTLQANMVTSIFAVGMFNGEPKAEIVTAQTAALPGLPQTGSNPAPLVSSDGQLSTPWLLFALALVIAGCAFFARRVFSH